VCKPLQSSFAPFLQNSQNSSLIIFVFVGFFSSSDGISTLLPKQLKPDDGSLDTFCNINGAHYL
jgi:hypothetical protein